MSYDKTIKANTSLKGMVEILPDIVFSEKNNLKMQVIAPWWDRLETEIPEYPLIVFVQGSAWTFPNVWYEVPQLCMLAKRGFVVATVTHRNSMEKNPFPACLNDVKTAIRFLRKHAKDFGIDAERVGIFGTSSGANLSLLTAMSNNSDEYKTEEHSEYSDKVNCCIACFPPSNLVESMQDENFDEGIKEIFKALTNNDMTVLEKMSPTIIAEKMSEEEAKKLVPILICHGDKDNLIPFKQGRDLYDNLIKKGANTSFIKVTDAPHEGSFWSDKILELIFDFIEENI